jgi:hypothetical protein
MRFALSQPPFPDPTIKMKTLTSTLILLFGISAAFVHTSSALARGAKTETHGTAYFPVDSTIKVYFVTGMFSPQQRSALWATLENWKSTRSKRANETKFVDYGETSGLIDCHGCLTIVREAVHTNNSAIGSSFNRLRQDEGGRLISAWIGIDQGTVATAKLRDLLTKALERGLGV